jgi:beta-hydroxylase
MDVVIALVISGIVLVYVASIIFVRVRNADPFELKRQLSDFSTFTVPFNIPAYLLSKVPTSAYIPQRYFPALKVLEDNWQVIRDEALALYKNGHIAIKNDLPGSSFYKDNRWTSFYLKAYHCDIPSARQLAPKTMALIDQVPGMNLALFACLNPGKRLGKHHDPFAFSIRYSLGLSTPNSEKCGITVNGQHNTWEDGKGILFDETFSHYAYNDTEVPRIILMTDIDRPLKSRVIQKIYYWFGKTFNSLFAIDNLDSSKTGWGNKVTPFIKSYQKKLRQFKAWNKPLYVASKIVVFVLIVGLIIWAVS